MLCHRGIVESILSWNIVVLVHFGAKYISAISRCSIRRSILVYYTWPKSCMLCSTFHRFICGYWRPWSRHLTATASKPWSLSSRHDYTVTYIYIYIYAHWLIERLDSSMILVVSYLDAAYTILISILWFSSNRLPWSFQNTILSVCSKIGHLLRKSRRTK